MCLFLVFTFLKSIKEEKSSQKNKRQPFFLIYKKKKKTFLSLYTGPHFEIYLRLLVKIKNKERKNLGRFKF